MLCFLVLHSIPTSLNSRKEIFSHCDKCKKYISDILQTSPPSIPTALSSRNTFIIIIRIQIRENVDNKQNKLGQCQSRTQISSAFWSTWHHKTIWVISICFGLQQIFVLRNLGSEKFRFKSFLSKLIFLQHNNFLFCNYSGGI